MLLTEAAGKRLLRAASVPLADGGALVTTADELDGHGPWTFPVAAKAQVRSGGRGKAGGVLRCDDHAQLRDAFAAIMASRFAGEKPTGVLVEPWLVIDRELYLCVVVDPSAHGYSVLYSPTGGIEIESGDPPVRYAFGHPVDYRGHELRQALAGVESDAFVRERVVAVARQLLQVAVEAEATTVEVNPLAIVDGRPLAVDAKVVLDDQAAFRHAFTADQLTQAHTEESEAAAACRRARLVFVALGGTVGLVSGGAGMTMRAMDAIADGGGAPAGFLDISNNPTPEGLEIALRSLQRLGGVDRLLISIFGGGLDVGRIARSLVQLVDDGVTTLPIAYRLAGSGADAATELLARHGFVNHTTLEAAVAELLPQGGVR